MVWALVVTGLGMGIGGAVLVVLGLRDLGRNLTAVPHPRDGAELVETGIYRFVRHPIYGGLIAMAVAWGLMNASLLTLLMAAVLALFFDLKSRREEAWLRARYGRLRRVHAADAALLPAPLLSGHPAACAPERMKKPGGEVGRRGPTLPPGIESASPVPPPFVRERGSSRNGPCSGTASLWDI